MDIRSFLIKTVFPAHCPFCDAVLSENELICNECRAIPKRIKPPYCLKCGKHVNEDAQEFCYDCLKQKHFFERGISLYEYASVHDSMMTFKNRGRPEYGIFYGTMMARILGPEILSFHADAIIPIPLHKKRLKKRGYNQSEILSEQISTLLNLPIRKDILSRDKMMASQKKMSLEQRQNNMKKAFHIVKNDVKLKSIILVDDIYTTGNTINAAALALKETGIEKVYFVTAAIGRGRRI